MTRVPIVDTSSLGTKAGIQNSTYVYAADAGANDSYAITLTPAVTALAGGQEFKFYANTANTGAASLAVNGLTAKTIKKLNDQDLATGDIEAGQIVTVIYNATDDVFEMQSQIAATPSSGSTARHIVATVFDDISTNRYDRTVTGSGAITNGDGDTQLNTGATDGSYAYLVVKFANDTVPGMNVTSFNPSFSYIGRMTSNTSTGNYVSWGAVGVGALEFNTSAACVTRHFGFVIDGAVLYATNADGSTQTKTDVSSGITLTDVNVYYIKYTTGANIKFYVNGVLVATHTTNLPTSLGSKNFTFGMDNDAGTTQTRLANYSSATFEFDLTS